MIDKSIPPKYSVVIPTFNRAHKLTATIGSILSQTEKDLELIVVDDGSTDGTVELVKSFEDSRIKCITQPNSGAAAARALGCKNSSGEWIAFCDSDDTWGSTFLSSLDNASELTNCSVFFSNYSVEDESYARLNSNHAENWVQNWSTKISEHLSFFKEDFYLALLEWQPIFISAFAIKRELYESIGGISEDLRNLGSEDAHLTRRAAAYGKCTYSNKDLVNIGRQDDNLSSNYLNNMCGGASVLERLVSKKEIPERFFEPTVKETINHYIEICDQSYWSKNYKQSIKYARKVPLKDWTKRTFRNVICSQLRQYFNK